MCLDKASFDLLPGVVRITARLATEIFARKDRLLILKLKFLIPVFFEKESDPGILPKCSESTP